MAARGQSRMALVGCPAAAGGGTRAKRARAVASRAADGGKGQKVMFFGVLAGARAAKAFAKVIFAFTEVIFVFTDAASLFTEVIFVFTDVASLFTEVIFAFTDATSVFTEAIFAFTEMASAFTDAPSAEANTPPARANAVVASRFGPAVAVGFAGMRTAAGSTVVGWGGKCGVALDRAEGIVTMPTHSMKTFPFLLALAVVASGPLRVRADVADGVEAVVHGEAITFSEVDDHARPAVTVLKRQYLSQPDVLDAKVHETVTDTLNQLVERQLILHSFDAEGYQLPEGVVDDLVQERIREHYGDRVTLIRTLQAEGMTFEQFRKQVREQYIESALRNQKVQREIILSPYKVQTYYLANLDKYKLDDQVKLRMIVFPKPSGNTNTVAFAQEIQAQIKAGASFAEMAGLYSQGSQQHQAGDWGWVERSVLRKELAAPAFTLAVGQVSEVIDTPDTVYLMLVEDRKPAQARPLAEVRTEIEKVLRTQQQAALQKQWIDGLKKKTFVRYFQ